MGSLLSAAQLLRYVDEDLRDHNSDFSLPKVQDANFPQWL
jgi:hypothetical protein